MINYQINKFYLQFSGYVDNNMEMEIKNKYFPLYKSVRKMFIKRGIKKQFIKDYKYLHRYVEKYNINYIENELKHETVDKVNGYELDKNQKKAVICDEINNLIIAGAGSGKTLTIVGKIQYLIHHKNVNPKEILCISFTNESCNSLREKINNMVEVLTFHKLALKILNNKKLKISNLSLDFIVDEYFYSIIYNNIEMIYNVLKLFNIKSKEVLDSYKKIMYHKEFKIMKRTIITFINLFKANNFKLEKFLKISNHKNKILLSIILDIYFLYESELHSQGEIDFNDMINLATEYIEDNKINLRYKYIIIDEYQDTSYTRYKLVKTIVDNCKAKLVAVGDDWQSIYKFTGCNLDIFLYFEKYYGYTKKLYICNTYRNCQELINVAGKFVLKNKKQIKKKLNSEKHIKKPIKIIYENTHSLEHLLEFLANNNVYNIMILGRNNNDINNYLTNKLHINNEIITHKDYKNLKIRYITIHKSKGLEEDCVIIINLRDSLLGLPSKIKNSSVIDLISSKEKYLYEEERRLFYVGLTRTKSDVYLITPEKKSSIFVKEIIKNNKKYIEYLKI